MRGRQKHRVDHTIAEHEKSRKNIAGQGGQKQIQEYGRFWPFPAVLRWLNDRRPEKKTGCKKGDLLSTMPHMRSQAEHKNRRNMPHD